MRIIQFLLSKGSICALTLILFIQPFNSISQTLSTPEDSVSEEPEVIKARIFYHFNAAQIDPDTFIAQSIDTNLTNFFNYNYTLYNFDNNLGNFGSAHQRLLARDSIRTGLNYSFDNYDVYRFGINTIKFRELTQPYASITYLNGAQNEEMINAEFSQNIRENWNMGFQYRKISSEGFYVRQRNAINNFQFDQHFKSKNHKYQLILYGAYNDNQNESGGGILFDSLFTDAPEKISRKGFQVQFENAINRSRQQEYFVRQRFNFGPTKKIYYRDQKDSVYIDSIILEQTIPMYTLQHTFLYQHQEHIFEDKNLEPTNYPFANFLAGTKTFDVTLLNSFDNEVALIAQPWAQKDSSWISKIKIKAGLGFQYGSYAQYTFDNLVTDRFQNNTYLNGQVYNSASSKYHFKASSNLVLNGYNEGDLNLQLKNVLRINDRWKLAMEAKSSLQRPAQIFDEFNGTGWNWNTNFNKVGIVQGDINVSSDSNYFNVGVFYQALSNYAYFGSDGLPRQYDGTIASTRPYVEKLFNFGVFHLNVQGGYQFISQAGIINLPELYTYNSAYIESRLFKSEMLLRLGANLFFTSEYTADDYNPATRQFFIQTQQTVGGYPWLEPFLMVNVEQFYFFVRMANINEGLPNYNYLARPGYPMQDRALKFSVRWDLFN